MNLTSCWGASSEPASKDCPEFFKAVNVLMENHFQLIKHAQATPGIGRGGNYHNYAAEYFCWTVVAEFTEGQHLHLVPLMQREICFI
jgi:hypothetical protein